MDFHIEKIERCYPSKKNIKNYPLRYNSSVFEKFNEMIADKELQQDYEKWKNGISYLTNRKIKIGGKIHNGLKGKFMISYSHQYNLNYRSFDRVLFEELININQKEYLQETRILNEKIDKKNIIINKYNELVDKIIKEIQLLNKWNDYVEFEGKKYGVIEKIKDNIHIENDCLGNMVFTCEKDDVIFNDRPFCNYSDTRIKYSIYNCSKCNFEIKIEKSRSGGEDKYISKIGFWWK